MNLVIELGRGGVTGGLARKGETIECGVAEGCWGWGNQEGSCRGHTAMESGWAVGLPLGRGRKVQA